MPPSPVVDDLIAHIAAGLPRGGPRRIGLEYEQLGVLEESGEAIPYHGPRSVVAVLEGLVRDHGWSPVGSDPLLELQKDGSRLTLEPGSQIELSARPHTSLGEAGEEVRTFGEHLRRVSRPLRIRWLPLGLQPLSPPDRIELIPKERYRIMAAYLPTRGRLASWMMRASAGMQVNLDVADAADAARTLRLALSVSSVTTALFANSPLAEGRENGWASRRARIWTEVDPDRCGIPEALLSPSAGLPDYASWALDAGMFFIERAGHLVDMTGVSFRRFLEDGAAGHRATLADWELHLTTLFPEARLRPYLEVRGGDSNRLDRMLAYAVLWKGLVYGGDDVRAEALALASGWSRAERIAFHEDCARRGLGAAAPGGRSARELAAELVALAETGLREASADDDRAFLDPARELVEAGRSPAEELLEAWRGPWRRSVVEAARALDPD